MPRKKSKNPAKILEIHKRMHASDDTEELIRLEFEKMKARFDQNEENRKFASGVRKGNSSFSYRNGPPKEEGDTDNPS